MTDSLPTTTDPVTRTAPTLQEARKAKGLTQQQLANVVDVSIGTIREYEQLVRTVMYTSTWRKLCDALDVDFDTGFHGLTRTFNR